jgi:hypothetical protein
MGLVSWHDSLIEVCETEAEELADRFDVLKCDGATIDDEIPLLGLMLSKRRDFLASEFVGFLRFLGLVCW